MADIIALVAAAEKMGYKGEDLKSYVEEHQKFQETEARDQRALEREKIKEKEADRALEEERIRLERDKLKSNEMLEMERLKVKREELSRVPGEETKFAKIKLPMFEEHKDSFDSYISRFENVAKMRKWGKEEWPTHLSLLLTGRALDTFFGLSETQQRNYDVIKEALMRKYALTEEQFRRQFYSTGIEQGETIQEFMARLERLFTKWVEASKITKDYNGLTNLLIREGFYQRCDDDLAAYLREKAQTNLEEIVVSAQRYVDAHGGTWGKTNGLWKADQSGLHQLQQTDKPPCSICGKMGHAEEKCWFKDSERSERKCFRCGANDHLVRDCKQEKENVGSLSVVSSRSSIDLQEKYKGLSPEVLGKVLRVPMSEGKVNGHRVLVMRDTGFGYAAVKTKFVKAEDYLDEYGEVYLLDNTRRRFQKAMVEMDTEPFSGRIKVLAVDKLVVDCVIGNIDGVKNDSITLFKNDNARGECAATVLTRAQSKAGKKPLSQLVVEESQLADRRTFVQLQKEDPSLDKIWDLMGNEEKKTKSGTVRFEVRKDLLYRIFTPDSGRDCMKQLVVPQALRERVISTAHDNMLSGHCGIKRTIDRVFSNFYWPELREDVRRFCRSCSVCQKMVVKGRQGKAPMQRMPIIGEPFRRVAVDLVGPITPSSERGHKYILTVMDYATRYPEAESLKAIDTITVAEALISIFCRIGFPEEMLTDRGSQFMSEVLKEVNRLLSLKHLKTTAWHPMCNGLVERFNGTLKTILKRLCAECPKQWDRYLPAVLFAYRSSIQESSGFTPFELVFGRKVRGPMEILRAYWGKEEQGEDVKEVYQYVVELKQRLQQTCDIAQEELLRAQEVQKRHYDRSARTKALEVGQKVLLLLPTKANKLLLQWRGPYVVTEKTSPVNYIIQMGSKRKTYHVNMLKPYIERHKEPSETQETGGTKGRNVEQEGDIEETNSNETMGNVDENTDYSEESQDIAKSDEEDYSDNESELNECDDAGQPEIAASMVLKDGINEVDHSELIEVCPLTSMQSWEDVIVNDQLSSVQQDEVKSLLQDHADVLTTVPGYTDQEEHTITTTTSEPVRTKPYPLPYSQREVVAKEINDMLRMNIIRPSKSPYAAPPVLIQKPDGSIRFCVNYKKLNQVTIFDGEPMPCPEDVYIELRGKKYRTKMDLTKGYWQIGVHPDSIQKTAFTTPDGVYEFLRLPFGLKNSAATFNRLMRRVLGDMNGVGCFVDDIIVYTDTWSEHVRVLKEVFRRLRDAGLTVKPSKCTIGVTDVEFVGHKVSIDTLQPRPEKIADVLNVERPQTRRQVKSFLAMAGYYSRFIKNFSDITYPLTELTKARGGKLHWGEREELSFQAVKRQLSQEPILQIVDFSRPMYVQTDASDVGLGGALLQEHNGLLHPVRYLSRKLKSAERNYSTIEKEGLAIVWALEKLRVFLYGREFILLTDHKPLTFINNMKLQNSRVMRWSLFLQDWAFRVESVKGVDNLLADYLSRA